MSVRRRAISERKARDGMRRKQYEEQTRWVNNVRELVRRKMLFADSTISVEELAACFDKDAHFARHSANVGHGSTPPSVPYCERCGVNHPADIGHVAGAESDAHLAREGKP